MKNLSSTFKPLAIFAALGLASLATVSAPTFAAPKSGARAGIPDRDAKMTQLPPRVVAAIEQKTGKKLTAAQQRNLLAAMNQHREEMRKSRERFGKSFAAITGVPAEEMRALMRPGRGEGRGPGFGGPREGGPGEGRRFGGRGGDRF